ncbi:MAG TPA: Gfo/Idh/MocA family oxidoreductase [Tepidisphaeraceae bacterium]|nr:Gfo/Idh/MocA family oxidoreductase [Tepidisphaeraceae bacterium]
MGDLIRYAIVGLGRAGWDIHVAMLRSRPDMRIVGVVDPEPSRVDQAVREFSCQPASSLDHILTMPGIDVVVLATPSRHHADEAIACLSAGKHVVVEKPMAMSVAESDRMIEAAHQSQRHLFINQSYRYRPELLHLKAILASGVLGRIFHVRHNTTSFTRRNDWQTLSKFGGGLLNNTGAHYIDFTLQLLPGRVTEVMGDLQQIASAGDVEDHVKALLRTDARATADIEITMAENLPANLPKWTLCGTTGTAVSDGKTTTLRYFDPRQAPPIQPIEGAAPDRRYGNDDILPWQEKMVSAADYAEVSLYDNVHGVLRGTDKIFVTPESVRDGIRVMEMIRNSSSRFTA